MLAREDQKFESPRRGHSESRFIVTKSQLGLEIISTPTQLDADGTTHTHHSSYLDNTNILESLLQACPSRALSSPLATIPHITILPDRAAHSSQPCHRSKKNQTLRCRRRHSRTRKIRCCPIDQIQLYWNRLSISTPCLERMFEEK